MKFRIKSPFPALQARKKAIFPEGQKNRKGGAALAGISVSACNPKLFLNHSGVAAEFDHFFFGLSFDLCA